MIRRIDLFMPPLGQYGVLHHFTKKLYEALMRCGVNCRLMEAEKNNPQPFLTQLFNDPPDCTLSFNGLLPDDEGRFFCDLIKIPHVACLVDSPNHFFSLIRSPYNIICCVDRFSCDFFKGMKHENVIFLPHGIEKNISFQPEKSREYDLLAPTSYIDYEAIAKKWNELSPALSKILHSAAEIALSSGNATYVEAVVESLQKGNNSPQTIQQLDFVELLDQLEMYIRGYERVHLIKAIKNTKIDIFGAGHSKSIWQRHLGKDNNVVIHEPVPFEQMLDLMKNSKIVLNSCPWIKYGTHERTLAGLACGAAVLTDSNPYMQQYFTDKQSILFYSGNDLSHLDSEVSSVIKNENLRQTIAKNGRDIVLQSHTWDNRAAQLIKDLDPMVKKVKEMTV